MVKLRISDEDFERTARNQREWIKATAEKILRGESLSQLEAMAAAAALNAFADSIPLKQKRPEGREPSYCPGSEVLLITMYETAGGMSRTAAIERRAEDLGVSPKSFEKVLRRHGLPPIRRRNARQRPP